LRNLFFSSAPSASFAVHLLFECNRKKITAKLPGVLAVIFFLEYKLVWIGGLDEFGGVAGDHQFFVGGDDDHGHAGFWGGDKAVVLAAGVIHLLVDHHAK